MHGVSNELIRVLLVMEATIGGTRKHLVQLARHLSRERLQITIACSALRDEGFRQDIDELREMGVPIVELLMYRQVRPLADLRSVLFLRRLLRQQAFDIVHTHGSKAGFVGRIAGRLAGNTVFVHTPHSFAFLHDDEFPAWKRQLFLAVERKLGAWTSRLIAVSDAEGRAALEYGIVREERIRRIANGIEPELADHSPLAIAELRSSLGQATLDDGDRVVGCVGLLEVSKGHEVLISALPRVVSQIPRLKCLLIGDGSQRRRLEELVERAGLRKVVVFAGHRENASELMSAFEALVLPSLWEGLPYVLLEAMSLGIPVVSSRVGGCAEVVVDGETGYLIPPGDATALAEALCRLLGNRERASNMGRRGRERVLSRYGLQRMIASHEAVYTELTSPQIDNVA